MRKVWIFFDQSKHLLITGILHSSIIMFTSSIFTLLTNLLVASASEFHQISALKLRAVKPSQDPIIKIRAITSREQETVECVFGFEINLTKWRNETSLDEQERMYNESECVTKETEDGTRFGTFKCEWSYSALLRVDCPRGGFLAYPCECKATPLLQFLISLPFVFVVSVLLASVVMFLHRRRVKKKEKLKADEEGSETSEGIPAADEETEKVEDEIIPIKEEGESINLAATEIILHEDESKAVILHEDESEAESETKLKEEGSDDDIFKSGKYNTL